MKKLYGVVIEKEDAEGDYQNRTIGFMFETMPSMFTFIDSILKSVQEEIYITIKKINVHDEPNEGNDNG